MSWIPKDATDLEKVKAVHDWLCAHVDYDYDTESAHDGEPWEYDRSTTYGLIIKNGIDGRFYPYNAYGALVEHYCVCDGYSYAFNLLMDQLGIPCQHISYGSHAWNSVQIDGSWYHVDATWDACSTPWYNRITTEYWWAWEPSSLCYNYFMKSDDGIQAVDTSKGKSPYAHAGYSKTYFHAATNPQYDNEADSFWEAQSPTAGVLSQNKIESFSLSQSQTGLAVGETMQLAMNDLEPSDANPRCASWSSSNPDVAYVFGDGTVLATGNGTATITCTTQYYVDVVDESRNHTRETRMVARTCKVTVGEAVELEPSFTTAQLVLGEQIAMRFGLDIPEGVDCSGGSAVFSITSPNGKKNRITDPIPLSQADVSSGTGTYGFKFELSSIEMSQPITCTFTYGVDKQVTLTSSVRQYVQRVEELAQTEGVLTDSQVACVHAIANYGHYMQPFLQRNSNPVWRLDEDYQTMDVFFAGPGKGQDDYVVDAAGFVQ